MLFCRLGILLVGLSGNLAVSQNLRTLWQINLLPGLRLLVAHKSVCPDKEDDSNWFATLAFTSFSKGTVELLKRVL